MRLTREEFKEAMTNFETGYSKINTIATALDVNISKSIWTSPLFDLLHLIEKMCDINTENNPVSYYIWTLDFGKKPNTKYPFQNLDELYDYLVQLSNNK